MEGRGAVDGQQLGIGVNAVCRRHFLEERGLLHATKSPPVLPGTFEYRCGVNRAEPADELVDFGGHLLGRGVIQIRGVPEFGAAVQDVLDCRQQMVRPRARARDHGHVEGYASLGRGAVRGVVRDIEHVARLK